MSSSGQFTFPSPIGGVPFQLDHVPSILFAILYGLLIPLMLYRLISKKSRNFVLIGTIPFAIERIVVMSLRAARSNSVQGRTSNSLTKYFQTSWAIAYISLATDLIMLLRSLLVHATESSALYTGNSAADKSNIIVTTEGGGKSADEGENREKERRGYRQICGLLSFLTLPANIIGIIAGIDYVGAETDQGKATKVQALRYAVAALIFCTLLGIQGIAIYSVLYTRNIIRSSALLVAGLAGFLNVITVYRLVVMHFHTTSLTSLAPGSLNSTESKACFYVFQIAPEWITAAILLGINVKARFQTGLYGDGTLIAEIRKALGKK